MLFKGENHNLLKEPVTQHELLGGSGDVSVVVQDSHTCVSGDVHLEGHMRLNIHIDLSLGSRERTH